MLGEVSIAVKNFGVCDFSRLAVTDWRLRRWRLWFLALMTATQHWATWATPILQFRRACWRASRRPDPRTTVEALWLTNGRKILKSQFNFWSLTMGVRLTRHTNQQGKRMQWALVCSQSWIAMIPSSREPLCTDGRGVWIALSGKIPTMRKEDCHWTQA